MSPGQFHEVCLLLAVIVPFSEHSGIRSQEHNREVGGVWNSGHRLGLAKDIRLDHPKEGKVLERQANKLRLYVQVINKAKGDYHLEAEGY